MIREQRAEAAKKREEEKAGKLLLLAAVHGLLFGFPAGYECLSFFIVYLSKRPEED